MYIVFRCDKGWGGGGVRPREDDVTHRILEEPTVDCTRVWAPEASLCDQHLHRQTGEMQNKPRNNNNDEDGWRLYGAFLALKRHLHWTHCSFSPHLHFIDVYINYDLKKKFKSTSVRAATVVFFRPNIYETLFYTNARGLRQALIVFGFMGGSLTQWSNDRKQENYARRLTRQCLCSS